MRDNADRSPRCPPREVLARVVHGQGTTTDEELVTKHLNECEQCRRQYDALFDEPSTFSALRSAYRKNCQVDLDALRAMCIPCLTTWEVRDDHVQLSSGLRLELPRDSRYVGRLDRYDIEGMLGRGGMGLVLKGFDPTLQRYVALKLIRPTLIDDAVARGRFIREARTTAKLQHPNIVTVYGVELDYVRPYLVMEYVHGMSLASMIETQGPLPPEQAVEFMVQLLSALAYAHSERVLHRDIKPGNVLIDHRQRLVKLADFGLARGITEGTRYTLDGTIMGTPWYMSPEQAAGSTDLDSRSDLFSAGVVLFEMLTGHQPFPGKNCYRVVADIREREAPDPRQLNPSIADSLASIVLHSVQKKLEDRYGSGEEFIAALQGFLRTERKRDESMLGWDRSSVQAGPEARSERPASEPHSAEGPTEGRNPLRVLFRTTHPRPPFQARIWTERSTSYATRDLQAVDRYRIGERFTLNVQVGRDCHLTLLDLGTSGNISVLLQNQPVSAGKSLRLAGPDCERDWVVGEPTGVERIKAFFTVQPLCLDPASSPLAACTTPGHTRDVTVETKNASVTLDQMPADLWCEAMCEFTVSR
jgi:serine/threonine-protein kinase